MAPRPTVIGNRRRTALLGVVAILFQAILFGWHHHELHFAGRQSSPTAIVTNGTAPPLSEADGDCCEICLTLHHQSAAAPEFAFAPPPPPRAAAPVRDETALIVRPCALAFQARAPPLA